MPIWITRTSKLTGTTRTKLIDITPEELNKWRDSKNLVLIQDAFPNLSATDREFILTGITDDEWNKYLGQDKTDLTSSKENVLKHGKEGEQFYE